MLLHTADWGIGWHYNLCVCVGGGGYKVVRVHELLFAFSLSAGDANATLNLLFLQVYCWVTRHLEGNYTLINHMF